MCRIVQNTEASAFIFWYHDNRMINYDSDRGINVSTEAGLFYFHHFTSHHITSVFVKYNPCWVSVDKHWISTSFFGYLETAFYLFIYKKRPHWIHINGFLIVNVETFKISVVSINCGVFHEIRRELIRFNRKHAVKIYQHGHSVFPQ